MEKEIIKKIIEFIKESEDIMKILRAEAIDQTHNWKKYSHKREAVDERINKLSKNSEELETSLTNLNLEKESIVSVEDYNKLLANQKPDNLPADWETQLADKKQLEIKLNTIQTDLSKEQQARQQAESKIQQAEKFGLTDWDNLANQIDGETLAGLLERPKKSELEEIKRGRDQRPNITVEEYNKIKNNQKPLDYDDIKSKLDEWEKGLEGQTLEQVRIKLNKMSELEKRPTSDQQVGEESGIIKKTIPSKENIIKKTIPKEESDDKLNLEDYKEEWEQRINRALKDEDNKEEKQHVELTRFNVPGSADFSKTLREKTSKEEVDKFGFEMLAAIAMQRQRYVNIITLLNAGEAAFEGKNFERAKEISLFLETFRELVDAEEKKIFRSSKIIVRANKFKNNINSLSQQAQVIQDTK